MGKGCPNCQSKTPSAVKSASIRGIPVVGHFVVFEITFLLCSVCGLEAEGVDLVQ